MSEQLKHIFDVSKCPTKRQLQDYLNGTMQPEEVYGLEHHLSSCLLCSEAVDGMMEHQEAALAGLQELNNTFLKDHLELHPPHIHLNSITPAAGSIDATSGKASFWKPVAIAATLLLCLGLGWYLKNASTQMGQNTPAIAQAIDEDKLAETIPLIESNEPLSSDNNESNNGVAKTIESEKAPLLSTPSPAPAAATEDVKAPQKKIAANESVTEYKKPLLKREADVQRTAEKETQKMATTNTSDVSSLSAGTYQSKKDNITVGGARSNGSLYVIDGVKTNEEAEDISSKKEIEDANKLYKNEQYSKALSSYKKQFSSSDIKTRQTAKLMAARCYIHLNDRAKAENLLNDLVVNGNGSERRQAKKLLKQLERDASIEEK